MNETLQRTIMILSESPQMFERVKHLLEKKSRYHIIYVDSYDEAYNMVIKNQTDFVFYEIDKALKDGVRKLDQMKQANSRVPVVVSALLNYPPRPHNAHRYNLTAADKPK